MNNIVKKLKDRNITSQIKYYGLNDMATGFEIKNIVENYDLYIELIDGIKQNINSVNDYINYLYIKCLSKYRETLPIVREDLKSKVESIIVKAEQLFVEYKEADLAKYIAKNYKKILADEFEELYIKHDVIDYTIELMYKYCNKDNDAIEYIIKNYSYKVYDNFNSFKKIFDESPDLYYYDLLLNEEMLKKDSSFRLDEIMVVLKHLKEKNGTKYNEKINILIDMFRNETFNATDDDVMKKYFRLRDFIKLLEELKHPKCYEFKKEFKNQTAIKDEYILKKGQEHSFTIDINPIIEILKNEKLEWYIKSLALTHTQSGKSKISVFEILMKNSGKKGIIDYVTSNINTDSTFTYSLINSLSITLLYGKYALNYMLSNETMLNNLLAYIIMGINNYFKDDSIYFNKEKVELDINMLYDGLIELKVAYKSKNDIKIKRIIYGLEVQLCGIIEKTLRTVYREINKEQEFIPFDSISLNSLLKQESLNKKLGMGNCQCIQYLLSRRDGNIGKNTRNNFTHYNDDIYSELNIDTILEALYILLIISNTLLCIKKD